MAWRPFNERKAAVDDVLRRAAELERIELVREDSKRKNKVLLPPR